MDCHRTKPAPEMSQILNLPIRPLAWVILIGFSLGVVRTLILVQHGLLEGRISAPPPYDDVSYFVDALTRLYQFYDGGVREFVSHLASGPPHSPLSTFLAVLSFAVAGPNLAAPYVLNGLIGTALIIVMVTLFCRSAVGAVLLIALLLMQPWFDWVVMTFHPDFVAGLMTAAACAAILAGCISRSRSVAAWLGLAAAVAIIAKPPSAPLSGILIICAAVGAGALTLWPSRENGGQNRSELLRRYAIFGVAFALPLAFFFAATLAETMSYIRMAIVDNADYLGAKSTTYEKWTFYWDYLKHFFSAITPLTLVLWLVALGVAIFRRQRTALGVLVLIFLLALAGYIAPTLPAVKIIFFGSYLYGLYCLLLVISVGTLFENQFPVLRYGLLVVLAVAVVVSTLSYRDDLYRPNQKLAKAQNAAFTEILSAIRNDVAGRADLIAGPRPIQFFSSYYWPISPENLKLRDLMDGPRPDSLVSISISLLQRNLSDYLTTARTSDYVIATTTAVASRGGASFPAIALQDKILESINADPKFSLVKKLDVDGNEIMLYRHAH